MLLVASVWRAREREFKRGKTVGAAGGWYPPAPVAIEGISSDDKHEPYTRSVSKSGVSSSQQGGSPMTSPSGSRRPLARPFARRYAELQGDDSYHPVDAIIDAIPAIAARGRRLRQMSARLAAEVKDRAAYIRYEDLRLEQQIDREELFFDAGHARGEIAGRQQSIQASAAATPNGRALARAIARAAMASELPRDQVVAVVLESARALVLGPGGPAPDGVGRKHA